VEEAVSGPAELAKFRGALIGCAVGDAVGELAAVHNTKRQLEDFLSEGDMLRYTDDTAMAIGLAEALTTSGGKVVEKEIGEAFRRNYGREPWREYSASTPAVFAASQRKGLPYSEAAAQLHGGQGSFGNGAAIRIAPLGLLFRKSQRLREYAEISARVTHTHPIGIDGAAIMAWAVGRVALLDPRAKFPYSDFCVGIVNFARTREMRQKLALVVELLANKATPQDAAFQLRLSQTVEESLPFSLFSFLKFPLSFRDCIYCAVLNGGDPDSLGSMAGALSGAYLGWDAIPKEWRARVENGDRIDELARRLNQLDGKVE
jgi:poly(ADP-ribose) glycohydrolase ARH3